MKSKRSFFSLAIILNDIKRFWWISAIYALLLFLASPLTILNRDVERYILRENTINLEMIMGGAWFFLALMPVMIGVMVFRYIQNSKSVTVIHSMPYTRLQLYMNHFLAGLILLLVPILLNAAILAGIGGFTDYGLVFEPNIVTEWLQIHFWISIALYAVTVAIGMFTGSSIAQIIFTYIYNFLAVGFLWGMEQVLNGNIYGFSGFSEDLVIPVAKFFPLTQIFLILSEEISMTNLAVINAIMFLVIGAIGYFVYRYRNLEDAGDVISNDILKPIFKYGVTICVMITGIVYVKGLFDIENPNFLIYLLFALIGYVIAEMLLRKSFRVWDSYKGFIGFIGAFAIVVLLVSFDVLGYEKYVPKASEIQTAFISDGNSDIKSFIESGYRKSWRIGVLTEEENIALVTDTHQKIVADRLLEDSKNDGYLVIGYLLKNGKIVKRIYNDHIERYEEEITKIENTREFRKSTNEIFDITEGQLKGVEVRNQITDKAITLSDPVVMKEILAAAKEVVYSSENTDFRNYGDRYCIEFIFEGKEERDAVNTKIVDKYQSIYFGFDDEDSVLKDLLIKAGCEAIFTDYSNVQSIRIMKLDEERDNEKMISDHTTIQAFIARMGELNDFRKDDDIYRVEFVCREDVTEEGEIGTFVNIRLYADDRFDGFYQD